MLECCCTDAFEAMQAEEGGAGRIELCEDLQTGGVTPREENIRETLESISIPANILIRVRGGDFVYDEGEIRSMTESIKLCKRLDVNGVVIGALKGDGTLDIDACRRMVEAAEGLHITFHRAFDRCTDQFAALEQIISLGCDRILTSGHKPSVSEGIERLKALKEKAGGRIIIMAGGGVRTENISHLKEYTGIEEFHSSSHGADGRTSAETVAKMVRSI